MKDYYESDCKIEKIISECEDSLQEEIRRVLEINDYFVLLKRHAKTRTDDNRIIDLLMPLVNIKDVESLTTYFTIVSNSIVDLPYHPSKQSDYTLTCNLLWKLSQLNGDNLQQILMLLNDIEVSPMYNDSNYNEMVTIGLLTSLVSEIQTDESLFDESNMERIAYSIRQLNIESVTRGYLSLPTDRIVSNSMTNEYDNKQTLAMELGYNDLDGIDNFATIVTINNRLMFEDIASFVKNTYVEPLKHEYLLQYVKEN